MILTGEITVHLRTLRSINIKYYIIFVRGATIANDFLCSSILAVLLAHNFYIQTIILSAQCYAWTEYKFTCVCVCLFVCMRVCVCVRHTFCQLASPLNLYLNPLTP